MDENIEKTPVYGLYTDCLGPYVTAYLKAATGMPYVLPNAKPIISSKYLLKAYGETPYGSRFSEKGTGFASSPEDGQMTSHFFFFSCSTERGSG